MAQTEEELGAGGLLAETRGGNSHINDITLYRRLSCVNIKVRVDTVQRTTICDLLKLHCSIATFIDFGQITVIAGVPYRSGMCEINLTVSWY